MDARQVIIAILSVPAVFLVCLSLLGVANVALRMALGGFDVPTTLRLVARWGLAGTIARIFVHDVRTGRTGHEYLIGFVLSRAMLGSVAVAVALILALSPTGLPDWVIWVSIGIGFLVFHVGLARDLRTVARPAGFFGDATAELLRRYDVPRASAVGSVLAVVLYRRWSSIVFFAFGLSMLFAVTRLVVANGSVGLAAALLVGGPAAVFPLVLLAGRVVDEYWAGAATLDAIQRRLAPRPRPEEWLRPSRQAFDRFADERRELTHVTDLLVRAADRLDSRAAPHPNAVLLRACAARVRAHLSSLTSLTARAPQSIDTLLAEASILFVGTGRPDFYAGLDRLTAAFGADGAPAPELTEPGRRGPWALVRRAADAAETSHKLVISVLGVVTVVVLAVLILTGRLSGTALLKP
jgi:hypothetical protein